MREFDPDKPVLAIGDCHGHLDRLEALLFQEGIIGNCEMCAASGDVGDETTVEICPACKGFGTTRVNHDCVVIQLGDLGHFSQGQTADSMIYEAADKWIDLMLWGNHDRAAFYPEHEFSGYQEPLPATKHRMQLMRHEGRIRLAHVAHGFLLTHAGLHKSFRHNKVGDELRKSPLALALWLNTMDDYSDNRLVQQKDAKDFIAIRDAIGVHRGGRSPAGGILWRDASEALYGDYRQVFGHSSKPTVRTYQTKAGNSYCIDMGTEHNGLLGGIWLPSERLVEVRDVGL